MRGWGSIQEWDFNGADTVSATNQSRHAEIASDVVHALDFRELSQESEWKKRANGE